MSSKSEPRFAFGGGEDPVRLGELLFILHFLGFLHGLHLLLLPDLLFKTLLVLLRRHFLQQGSHLLVLEGEHLSLSWLQGSLAVIIGCHLGSSFLSLSHGLLLDQGFALVHLFERVTRHGADD